MQLSNLIITNIDLVLRDSMKKGYVKARKSGRHLYCLVYILSGNAIYCNEKKTLTVNAGDLFFLSKGSRYSIQIMSEIYNYIFIDFDFLPDDEKILKEDFLILECPDFTENLFRRIEKQWLYKKPEYIAMCKSILYEIFGRVIQKQTALYIPQEKAKKLSPAINYFEEHFCDPDFSVSKLADMANMSEVHFRRIFKEIYLVSPIHRLNQLRINRAKDLLKYGRYSISDIAEMVGYSNIYYFSTVFKSETGKCPTEYMSATLKP